ncbi:MAG: M48 family metalloprotease [Cognatishimia sp.]|uniref:M48 family metalloprotease n=1 Tax=Cognatishimia sp. TaxID=2211648 RepID=UPI003B8B0BC6
MRSALIFVGLAFLGLAGCDVVPVQPDQPPMTVEHQAAGHVSPAQFSSVVERLAPVVQDSCEQINLVRNCKIRLYVARTPDGTANAFQSIDGFGRPFVVLTESLLADMRNEDEIALVLAHEAVHHILNHLERQRVDAIEGADVLADATERKGGTRRDIRKARQVGAFVGARLYAQEYELEADALGAILLREAGFDAQRGALLFQRIPDPGHHALNTHPSNAQRRAVVRDAVLNNKIPGDVLVIFPNQS